MRDRARHWAVPLVIAAITFVAFLPALNGEFVIWDDDKNFVNNLSYRGLGLAQLQWMWSTFHLGHYVPLSWMTLGLDYVLWGMNPRGYHLTNLLLHCGVAVTFYLVARRIFALTWRERGGEAAAAVFAALFFAVHPLRVESVAWITERRDLLSGLFYFAAVYAYLRAGQSPQARQRWYIAALLATVCAVLSKASAVTLPAALVVVEFLAHVRPKKRNATATEHWYAGGTPASLIRLAPFGLLAIGPAALAFVALQPEPQLSLVGKVAVSAYSVCFYLIKTLIPAGLAPLYAMPERVDPLQPGFLLAMAGVASLTGAAIVARTRWPALPAAWFAFLLIAFPLLGVHQNGPQIAADRYTYNAAAALALLAAGAAHVAFARFRRSTLVVATLVLATLAMLSWRQTYVWRNSAALWARVLRVEPNSPVAHNNAGNLLMRDGRVNEAIVHYRAAVAVKPAYAEAHDNLGVALAATGKFPDAIVAYQRALQIQPSFDAPQNNWGVALAQQGQLAEAIERFRLAISANPANADAHVNWGNAAVRLGRTDEAISHFEEALRFRPDHADAQHNWGVALARVGEFSRAAEHFAAALAIEPGHEQAREYLRRVQAEPDQTPGPTQPRASAPRP
ncbi:MAG: tetratricopeptide repeat protein [Gemmatimonadota bacterium]|nr:tetratricopeptide repeat protein [Gemmatimonadota bacterium]